MKLFRNIRRHMAVAGGNFAKMFAEVELPRLPAAATRLIQEFNKPECDLDAVAKILSADLDLSTKVLRTVNSAVYALPQPLKSVRHAVGLLGVRRVKSMALSLSMMSAVPRPDGDYFDHEAFWTDSVLRALLARSITRRSSRGNEDEAFTSMLLCDIALPVLLTAWGEYYAPIVESWTTSPRRLSEIERDDFGWDHGQAGAWILKQWEFPEEIVCLTASHTLPREDLRALDIEDTLALPLSIASLLPSVLRPSSERCERLLDAVVEEPAVMARSELAEIVTELRDGFTEIRDLFGLRERDVSPVFEDLESLSQAEAEST